MDDQETKSPRAEQLAGTVVVPLYAEEISVTTRESRSGRVRVSTITQEHEQLVEQQLSSEQVTVERVPVGKTITEMPEIRTDGETIIVPIVDEVLVVERRLILKEEVRIRRQRKTEKHQERVKLRKQEAVITRLAADQDNQGTHAGLVTEDRTER